MNIPEEPKNWMIDEQYFYFRALMIHPKIKDQLVWCEFRYGFLQQLLRVAPYSATTDTFFQIHHSFPDLDEKENIDKMKDLSNKIHFGSLKLRHENFTEKLPKPLWKLIKDNR